MLIYFKEFLWFGIGVICWLFLDFLYFFIFFCMFLSDEENIYLKFIIYLFIFFVKMGFMGKIELFN